VALGMLYNGSTGETRAEMAQALGMADFTETEINEYYQKMSQALLKIDPLTDIGIANSIWYRDGFTVKKPFIDVNRKYFDAMVNALDFNKPDAADIINKWCADKTKDKIKEIIKNPIPDDVMMYLINALYFKSKWQFEFEKKNTKQDDFTLANNEKVMVNMMDQTAPLPYYADHHLQCVEMPYGNQAFSMVAVLPDYNMNVDQLIEYLDNTTWQNRKFYRGCFPVFLFSTYVPHALPISSYLISSAEYNFVKGKNHDPPPPPDFLHSAVNSFLLGPSSPLSTLFSYPAPKPHKSRPRGLLSAVVNMPSVHPFSGILMHSLHNPAKTQKRSCLKY
jgi:hypothetical protein